MKLDAIDLRILETVQRDGRIIKVALVEKVVLSPTPCWMRLRYLGGRHPRQLSSTRRGPSL